MQVRGAPLIGVTAAYGICLAMRSDPSDNSLEQASAQLLATRPTAVNLRWAIAAMTEVLGELPKDKRASTAYKKAAEMADADVETCRMIGVHGMELIRDIAANKSGSSVNILTHCNAGWLATVDWGTALSPVYHAFNEGIAVHVFVDETRPRNQGASLTAYELGAHGVPHTVIVDNAGGHLMQGGQVDMCIVGTDRTAANGDVCNKIGTYLKALAAHDNNIPFYVALPHSTIDWNIMNGVRDIPIEERDAGEVTQISGRAPDGSLLSVDIVAPGSTAINPAFDVTPARLISGLITERGICEASYAGLRAVYFPSS
jgi:methylthioribose-1-phosphate isomerase